MPRVGSTSHRLGCPRLDGDTRGEYLPRLVCIGRSNKRAALGEEYHQLFPCETLQSGCDGAPADTERLDECHFRQLGARQ